MLGMLVLAISYARMLGTEDAALAARSMSAVVGPPAARGRPGASAAAKKRRKRGPRTSCRCSPACMILYLACPVLLMIVYASTTFPGERQSPTFSASRRSGGRGIWATRGLDEALKESIRVAIPTAAIATIIGTFIGLVLGRYSFRGRAPVELHDLPRDRDARRSSWGRRCSSLFVKIDSAVPLPHTGVHHDPAVATSGSVSRSSP